MLPRLCTGMGQRQPETTTTGGRAVPMSLASLVLLWSLAVPGTNQERLFGNQGLDQPLAQSSALPQRLPPLIDNGWAAQREAIRP